MPDPVIPQIPKEDLDHDLRQVFDTGIERTGDATIIGVEAAASRLSSRRARQSRGPPQGRDRRGRSPGACGNDDVHGEWRTSRECGSGASPTGHRPRAIQAPPEGQT